MKSLFFACLGLCLSVVAFAHGGDTGNNFVRIEAHNKFDRTKIVNLGIAIDSYVSDSVYATISDELLLRLQKSDLKILESFKISTPISPEDFPKEDARFHNYKEMTAALDKLVTDNPKIMKKTSIGKSLEGKDLWAVQVTSSTSAKAADGDKTFAAKPGIVFMGNHHAREHVSAEIPLMLLEFLAKNYGVDKDITRLVDTRDIYVIPMVNPDGVEYDISSTRDYKMHRKNTRKNSNGSLGVDLNRNYGYMWGKGGASKDPSDETYMGPAPFSEPETQAIRDFVTSHPNLNVLLSFHTFSELILYPWGHTYDSLSNEKDRKAFEAMATKMAGWNQYTPQQSSDLYIASGDTVDWAYGWSLTGRSSRIFPFTFELSPKSMWEGGFYPGASVLDRVFEDNLKPALYLIELADDPYRASTGDTDARLGWLN